MLARDRHCQQNHPHIQLSMQFGRVLKHECACRIPYVERQYGEYRSICHQGQRKLLISEIELLTRVSERVGFSEPILVVYAGAAPGNHIPMLSDMFPSCTFDLYDPSTFAIDETDRIRIFNRLFSDHDAHAYHEKKCERLVFISDIRTNIDEESVWRNMTEQKRWHESIQPMISSLKFRLPWDQPIDSYVQYLDGDIYLPVWGRTSTTECRLFVDKDVHKSTKNYSSLVYEEEMSYFNRVIRPALHLHTITDARFDRCYDCTAEIFVLRKYLTAFHVCSKEGVAALADTISESLHAIKMMACPVRPTITGLWHKQ